jgi:hypothetical protein
LTTHFKRLTVVKVTEQKTRIKINKAKATFTGRSPRHTQVGHPEGHKPKPGEDIRAVKGEGHVMSEII